MLNLKTMLCILLPPPFQILSIAVRFLVCEGGFLGCSHFFQKSRAVVTDRVPFQRYCKFLPKTVSEFHPDRFSFHSLMLRS